MPSVDIIQVNSFYNDILFIYENFIMEHILDFLSAIGGGIVILYALIRFASDIEKSRIDSKDKANHSIAQQAYATFFSSKLDAYIKLSNLKSSYLHAIHNFVPTEYGELDINVNRILYMNEIRNNILENHIYFSDELNEAFKNWNEKFTKIKVNNAMYIEEMWHEFLERADIRGMPAHMLADEETQLEYNNFLESEPELWNKLFETIDEDITWLKRRYDLSYAPRKPTISAFKSIKRLLKADR